MMMMMREGEGREGKGREGDERKEGKKVGYPEQTFWLRHCEYSMYHIHELYVCLCVASSMRPETGRKCPFRGQYLGQPDDTGCQLSIRSSCKQIDHIEVVSTCLKKPSTYHHFMPAAISVAAVKTLGLL